MRKHKFIFLVNALALLTVVVSCDKEEDSSNGTNAVFSYVADGFVVNFTNFSSNATEYLWDFDDEGATSTASNPSHVFSSKGNYLVSLTAINGEETSTFVDTVRVLGPNIKIDGDFTDWEHVGYSHVNEEDTGGTLLAVKTFASGNHLNFYVEGTSDMNFAVMNFYIDTDNDPSTGFLTWMYPAGSGAEFMGEGNYNSEDPAASSGAIYKYGGPGGSDWTWNSAASFGSAMQFSSFDTNNGRKAIEFSIRKDVLGDISGAVNFALTESNSGWTMIGSIPVSQTPESEFANFEL